MDNRPTGRVRWFLVIWLFVLGAVSYLDRVNISIAGTAIAAEYHLTQVQLGSIFSAFLLGYAFFQTPGGWLADKLGSRYVLTIGVVWWGIFTALTASVSPAIAGAFSVLVLIRFLLGAGEAIIYPASNQFIAQWIPSQERGFANGLIFAGVGAGTAVAPILVTYLMLHYGWRWPFWVSTVLGLLVGAVWYLVARDIPEKHPLVSTSRAFLHPAEPYCSVCDGFSPCPFLRAPQVSLDANCFEQKRSRGKRQLFLLWVCGMDFLQLVLHIPGKSTGPGSKDKRVLQHGAADRNRDWQLVRGRAQRRNDAKLWKTSRTLRAGLCGSSPGRNHSCSRIARCQCRSRQHCAVSRGGRTLPFAKLLLVHQCGHRRQECGSCFRLYEHGRPTRRSADSMADARDSPTLRLDFFLFGRSDLEWYWRHSVVIGRLRPHAPADRSERNSATFPKYCSVMRRKTEMEESVCIRKTNLPQAWSCTARLKIVRPLARDKAIPTVPGCHEAG